MVTRYIGNGRTRESGFMATHKQDFKAHVTGGDWNHNAADILVTGLSQSNVQDALAADQAVLNNAVIGPLSSVTSGTIPVFDGTTGKAISGTNYPISINGLGDLYFDNTFMGAETHYISLVLVDNSVVTEHYTSLTIEGQDNISGHGGDVRIIGGYSYTSSLFDGYVELYSDSVINISSPSGNVNLIGLNVNLAAETSVVFDSPLLTFPKEQSDPRIQQSYAEVGNGNALWISAQDSDLAIGGDLVLNAGVGPGGDGNVNLAGNHINLTAETSVVFDSPLLTFPKEQSDPRIQQQQGEVGNGNALWVSAQDGYLAGGDLVLNAGIGLNGLGGNLLLSAGVGSSTGNIVFRTPVVEFDEYQTSARIIQAATLSTTGGSLTIRAQRALTTGGYLNLQSGIGGDQDGYVNIEGGTGGVNISGFLVAVADPLFLRETSAPGQPDVAGVYLYVSGGVLYLMGMDGLPHAINYT